MKQIQATPARTTLGFSALAILSCSVAHGATFTWTSGFDAANGAAIYSPGESSTRQALPDSAAVNHNTTGPTQLSGGGIANLGRRMRPSNAEGLFDGPGSEQYSGYSHYVAEDNESLRGRMSSVFTDSYNLANVGDRLRITEAFGWGHMARSSPTGGFNVNGSGGNQILQFGVMQDDGNSNGQYFRGASNSLYLSFVATSATQKRWDATTAGFGFHTGDLTLRNDQGIVATLATGLRFNSNERLTGGNIVSDGTNNFNTRSFWYDINIDLTVTANNGLEVDVDIDQYSSYSDTEWRTHIRPADGELVLEDDSFFSATENLTSAQHSLGNLGDIDLNPAVGVDIQNSLNTGASGLVFDSNSTIIPEPSTLFFGSTLLFSLVLRRRRSDS